MRAQNIWSFSATGNLQHGTDGDGHYKNTDHHPWRSSEDGGLCSPGQSERVRGGVSVHCFPQCPYLPWLQKGKEKPTSLLFQIAIFNGVFPTYVKNNCLLCVSLLSTLTLMWGIFWYSNLAHSTSKCIKAYSRVSCSRFGKNMINFNQIQIIANYYLCLTPYLTSFHDWSTAELVLNTN